MTTYKANPLMAVEELELSTRAHNALINENILTIGELIKYNEAELLRFPNFGRKSLKEVQQALAGVGHKLSSNRDYVSVAEVKKNLDPIEMMKGYISKAVWKLDVLSRDFDDYKRQQQQMRYEFAEIAQVGGHGPTMRDQFAMAAMQANLTRTGNWDSDDLAKISYAMADAMIKAREVK